jgi:hypothetical protein
MNAHDGEWLIELTEEQRQRVLAIPPVKDLELEKPGASPMELEHEALERAVGRTLPRIRPRMSISRNARRVT